jgi:hypothetical protein
MKKNNFDNFILNEKVEKEIIQIIKKMIINIEFCLLVDITF